MNSALRVGEAHSPKTLTAAGDSFLKALRIMAIIFAVSIAAPAATFLVTNTNDSGAGSLRQAILDANATSGADTINFQIGTGAKTITLLSLLPTISNPVKIDGSTQPGYTGAPIIELSGNNSVSTGFFIIAGNSTVKGLVINSFAAHGILLSGQGGNTIANCYLGTSLDGMSKKGNGVNGITIQAGSSGNTIGGVFGNVRNVISGNQFNGIQISGGNGNFVEGNYIGTNATGTAALGNGMYGIIVSTSNNSIGVELLPARNLISGNARGIWLDQTAGSNLVVANYIGTNVDGTAAIPNTEYGIELNGFNNTIGGTGVFARNVISGNGAAGISSFGNKASGNVILGNYIGTKASGTEALGNGSFGIRLIDASSNTIGGTNGGARNVVSGNGLGIGIEGSSASNLVQGNYVGTDSTGTVKLGNLGGVGISAPNNTVGGTTPGAGNLISGNTESGILVQHTGHITIEGNRIGTNATGTSALGNGSFGLRMIDVKSSIIGGTSSPARNLVSGNGLGISIEESTSSGNLVQGNYVGTDVTGTLKLGNGGGVGLGGSNNTVGGAAAGAGNLISGNTSEGIAVMNAANNTIQGNLIGTNAAGSAALGNGGYGIRMINITGMTIGGTTTAARNVISGNGRGVSIENSSSTGNVIQGNYIGVDVSGAMKIANHGSGVEVSGPNNTIGGTAPGAGNVISGNDDNGVGITGSSANGNKVQGNLLGVNAAGTAAIRNGTGVMISNSPNTLIGGTTPEARNIISGNGYGVLINGATAAGNLVQGNFIGTRANGTDLLPNDLIGIDINTSFNNMIGGTAPGAGNIVAGNNYAGVVIDAGTGNVILGNSIFGNARLGIELSGQDAIGLNENDPGDLDTGANWKQNYPMLTSVIASGGNTSIQGKLNSNPNKQFRIEFFSNTTCDLTGFGEGQTFIGSTSVTTDAYGDVVINATLPVTPLGQFITATATSATNDTSEFSPCALVGGANPGTLQFLSSFFLVEEFQPVAVITVTRANGMAGQVSVDYATSDGTAKSPDDYAATSGTLTFADGEVIKTFTIPIVNDALLNEKQESVHLTLSHPGGSATLGAQSTSDLLINYADPKVPAVYFSDAAVVEGNNGTTDAVFTITLSAHSDPITVGYATVDGQATSPADYQSKSGQLVFNPGEDSKTVSVQVNGDTAKEGNEMFYLNLQTLSAGYYLKSQGEGLIIDDDGVSVMQFDQATYSVNEGGGSATITVKRSGDTSLPASVNYTTQDDSAKSGADYISTSGTLSFAAGETNKTFTVAVNDDNLIEGDEKLTMKLGTTSADVVLGAPGTASLTIVDNEAPPNMKIVDVSSPEGDSGTTTFTFGVQLLQASNLPVTVNVDTADGTATAGNDYQPFSGVLTFSPGQVFKTVTVSVNGDTTVEPDEKFFVNLSGASGANITKAQGYGQIVNDDVPLPAGTLQFSSVSYGVNENAGQATITVTRSGGSSGAVSVEYEATDGSAGTGDYTSGGGTLNWADGDTAAKTFTIAISNDAVDEADETINLVLGNATNGATVGSPSGAVLTIIDDDSTPTSPAIEFAQSSYSVQEDLSAFTVTVTRSGDTTAAASVDYTTADNSATQKNDYEYAAGTLSFAVGETSKTITILLNEDVFVEGNEAFSITLSNPAGGVLGAQNSAKVTIVDDQSEALLNPIDDAQVYVYTHYHDFLNREPDAAGLTFWTNEIASCGNDAQCLDVKRVNVSASFFLSIEFQETGYLLYLMQKESYGTIPKYASFMRDLQEVSRDVVVNTPGWQQKLADNQQHFAEAWVNRSEFKTAYDALSNDAYVNALYNNAGIVPPQTQKDKLITALNGASMSRSAVLLDVAGDATFRQQEQNAAFVLMQYFGYLRRDPNALPDSDFSGYNFWLTKLNQFGGNYINAEMVKAFITSFEYRQRFGQ